MPERNDDTLRLRDLRVLRELIADASLTRAAERMHMSQPSLSKVLARLRAHFGDPLFVRRGGTMTPTPRLASLAAPLKRLLLEADAFGAEEAAFEATTSTRVFRLLVSDVGMMTFLPPLLTRLSDEAPRVRLVAVPLDSRHFATKLESGEADLALGAFPMAPHGLRRQRLYDDGYRSVASKTMGTGGPPRGVRAFRAASHVVVTASDTGHAAHRFAQQALEAEIAPGQVRASVPSFIAAAHLAALGHGVATIPARLADALAPILDLAVFASPVKLPPIEIAQYWHEKMQRDLGHRWLRGLCFALFANSRH